MEKSRDAFRTISEVADWLGTPTHVLRFWESRFSQVKPVKRAGGRRYYRPADMELLGGIKKLVAGDQHTCALLSDSDLRCWGDNTQGQVDRTKRPRPTPFKVAGIRGATDVAAGNRHSCVLSGGKVYCWGLADSGALGPNPLR